MYFSASSFYFIICILDCVIVGIVLVKLKLKLFKSWNMIFMPLPSSSHTRLKVYASI